MRTGAHRLLAVLAAAVALASGLAACGDETAIRNGGRVAGTTLTLYSLLPRDGPRAAAARDVTLGEKLALRQAGGMVGDLTVNYVALGVPPAGGTKAVADAAREAIHDPGIAAVLGDLSTSTARVTAPLLNAAGILHVSPGATDVALLDDPAMRPSGRRSFAPVLAPDAAQAAAIARAADGPVAVEAAAGEDDQALAAAVRARVGETVATADARTVVVAASDPEDAFGVVDGVLRENHRARILLPQVLWSTGLPDRLAGRSRVAFLTSAGPASPAVGRAFEAAYGRAATPWAQVGYEAMRGVLDAIRRAGDRAPSRQALIDAYLAGDPLARAARRPWRLARRTGDGGTLYAPVGGG